MKICSQCKQNKQHTEFGPSKWADGYRAACNECRRTKEAPQYYNKHQSQIKEYRVRNRAKISAFNADYYQLNATYFERYRKKHASRYRKWRQDNRNYLNEFRRHKMKTDIKFKIAANLRSRLSTLLARTKASKADSTLKLLGCSLDEIKKYLESKFQTGMTWDNYGTWHIDHVRPCASFNLTIPAEQKVCFHYSNLQPLWAIDNLKKKDNWLL